MKFIKTILNNILVVLSIMFTFSCSSDDGVVSCVPVGNINRTINLNLPLYSILNNPGAWIYLEGINTGTRGLIIVNTGSGFKAYDRNAPHICPTSKTTIYVKEDIKMVCDEDGSEWILTSGQPTKVANRSPRTYQVIANGTQLFITN
jgi:nitrite reductase/ring-hydroxylating ferredoxin subunit